MSTDTPKLSAPFEAQFHSGREREWTILQLLRKIHTADLVKVLAVYPTAGTVGFVDVQPLVQERTTRDVVIAQAPIFRLPYMRLQGGASAVILDPVVGDLGVAVFAERDITNAINTREQGAAPTNRAFDAADGLYFGGFLNADPTQYVQFNPDGGITLVSTGDITLQAPGDIVIEAGGNLTLDVTGNVQVSAATTTWAGPVTFTSPVTIPAGATIGGLPFASHRHTSASAGSPTSTPIP